MWDGRITTFRRFYIPLLQKRDMRWKMFVVLLAAVSCGLSEIDGPSRKTDGGAWINPEFNSGDKNQDRAVCYVTAMDFRKGYDWRTDDEKGSVKCSLVVFADRIPVMKIPVGDDYQMSSDPDMHRMTGGNVYSDYSTETETIVKKNGNEIFRYAGRETICGMIVDSSGVYTLGEPRSGEGFSYRRNGEIIVERSSGRTFGRLLADGKDICFSFSEPVVSSRDTVERYYLVRNGVVSQEALREDVRKVRDMVSYKGRVCYVADMVGVRTPVLVSDGKLEMLDIPADMSMKTCRIAISSAGLMIEGICSRPGRPLTSILWKSPSEFHLFPDGMTVSSLNTDGGGVCCMLNPASASDKGVIYRNGESYQAGPGYVAMGSSSFAMVGGILHAGLSSKIGEKPVLWKDGIVDTLNVNGFITSVVVGE